MGAGAPIRAADGQMAPVWRRSLRERGLVSGLKQREHVVGMLSITEIFTKRLNKGLDVHHTCHKCILCSEITPDFYIYIYIMHMGRCGDGPSRANCTSMY